LNLPSKFISPDGHTLWLCYSANFARNWRDVKIKSNPPGSRYGLVLQQVRLLTSPDSAEMEDSVTYASAGALFD
ncbi:MAG: hypothetical protein ACYSR4_07740, partial [Planctomycetota bacterium]